MYLPGTFLKGPLLDLAAGHAPQTFSYRSHPIAEETTQKFESARVRLYLTGALLILVFLLIGLRLVDLMALTSVEGVRSSASQPPLPLMSRADIVDRNQVLLATNLATASLYANPQVILDAQEIAKKIAGVLPHLSEEEVLKKISSNKSFVWLARNLTPEEQARIISLGLPGLEFHREERRVYPQGSLVSHLLGFTDVDNHGIGGVEHSFDEKLRTSQEPLALAIDLKLQHVLYDELKKGIDHYKAQGGTGIIMNVKTGEILGMVSLPDFDPNHPQTATQEGLFNKSTLGIYEMGSIFKLFTAAMALEHGTVTMQSRYDATAPYKVARFKISDFRPKK